MLDCHIEQDVDIEYTNYALEELQDKVDVAVDWMQTIVDILYGVDPFTEEDFEFRLDETVSRLRDISTLNLQIKIPNKELAITKK